jgi:type VI secretion system secreted protein Hcp
MAVDMLLELDGIKGESVIDKHEGKIDVLAFSWGVSNSGTFHHGSGGGAGKADFQDLSITKYIDKATPLLLHGCASGKHIPKGKLIIRKAGEKPLEYLTYNLTNIMVTNVATGGSGGEERLTENVTLNFSKVSMDYKVQGHKGSAEAGGTFSWDVAKNVKA